MHTHTFLLTTVKGTGIPRLSISEGNFMSSKSFHKWTKETNVTVGFQKWWEHCVGKQWRNAKHVVTPMIKNKESVCMFVLSSFSSSFIQGPASREWCWLLFCFFVSWDRVSSVKQHWLSWNSICTPGWPTRSHRDPPASASQGLGLQACATTVQQC